MMEQQRQQPSYLEYLPDALNWCLGCFVVYHILPTPILFALALAAFGAITDVTLLPPPFDALQRGHLKGFQAACNVVLATIKQKQPITPASGKVSPMELSRRPQPESTSIIGKLERFKVLVLEKLMSNKPTEKKSGKKTE